MATPLSKDTLAIVLEALEISATVKVFGDGRAEHQAAIARARAELTAKKPPTKPAAALPDHPGPDASDREIYAYYKKTAAVSELNWTRRNASNALRAEIDQLLARKPTMDDAKRMRERRKLELHAAEVESGAPAIGSERWFIAKGIRPAPEPTALEAAGLVAVVTAAEESEAA